MFKLNPNESMSFNDALNAQLDIAEHIEGASVYMEFGGVEVTVHVPRGHIAPRVDSFSTIRSWNNDAFLDETMRRMKTDSYFYEEFLVRMVRHIEKGPDKNFGE